ncbi:major facilitator superfamily domain-containing protein [Blyttiomyces helicus]|uniref:Major facilitator superfamily domain-containing protein n=1 Tax=Blyttiomyces helicus TaxID=388810 RepID=A0A4P9WIW4_9FUNG|nr:major facilitator superfamily domain-containing protein [Blyttiomyces helicus]|eukprot:RKO92839.1 major facilitator superfamily domain-containing protein [Blyttiomyces helicus]
MPSTQTPSPSTSNFRAQVAVLLTSILPEAILEATLVPLYPFIVRYLLPGEHDVGYKVGLLSSAFYLPLFVTNVLWGWASDRVGRKPVLLAGLAVCALTSLLLALATTYTVVFSARLLAGLFGANSTVAKGALGELLQGPAARSWGYSMYGALFGISGMLGPLIGALLSDPATQHPDAFGENTFLKNHPYSLPCFLGFGMSVTAIGIAVIWMVEPGRVGQSDYAQVGVDDEGGDEKGDEEGDGSNENYGEVIDDEDGEMLPMRRTKAATRSRSPRARQAGSAESPRTSSSTSYSKPGPGSAGPSSSAGTRLPRHTLIAIGCYCLIASCNMFYVTSLPLYFSAPPATGLALPARDTSLAFSLLAGIKLLVQLLGCNLLVDRLGSRTTYRIGMAMMVPCNLLVPLIGLVPPTSGVGRLVAMYALMAAFGVAEALSYLSVILAITESVPDPRRLGLAHGLAATCAALARTVSPAAAGAIWEWGFALGSPWIVFAAASGLGAAGAVAGAWVATAPRGTLGTKDSGFLLEGVEDEDGGSDPNLT